MNKLFFVSIACVTGHFSGAQVKKGLGLLYKADSSQKAFLVTRIMEGNAADKAGIREGDFFFALNGKTLWGNSLEKVAEYLQTTPAPYKLSVRRVRETSLEIHVDTMIVDATPEEIVMSLCESGNCKDGKGRMRMLATGEVLEGIFANGMLVSGSTYYTNGKLKSSGTFKDGKLDGPACKLFWNKETEPLRSSGLFVDGKLRNGEFRSEDGKRIMRGKFDENGKPHDKDFWFRNGDEYFEGEIEHGLMIHAKRFSWQNGNYSGPLVKGEPHGKGSWGYQGRMYKGQWKNGMKQGNFNVTEKTGAGKYHHVYRFVNDVQQ